MKYTIGNIVDTNPCGYERERVDWSPKAHLPRLAPEHYRGFAFVHWTMATKDRATGWLDNPFHNAWSIALLHACHRYRLLCPAYVLMPDHVHVLWVGIDDACDQRVAIAFLRKHLRKQLAPVEWQPQAHDHVLRETEREAGAFMSIASYILENPVRAGLVLRPELYPYAGCCVPGYPDLEQTRPGYWELFWRIYSRVVGSGCSTRSRS